MRIRRADTESIQVKGTAEREEMGDSKETGYKGHTNLGYRRGRRRATTKSRYRGYTNQGYRRGRIRATLERERKQRRREERREGGVEGGK